MGSSLTSSSPTSVRVSRAAGRFEARAIAALIPEVARRRDVAGSPRPRRARSSPPESFRLGLEPEAPEPYRRWLEPPRSCRKPGECAQTAAVQSSPAGDSLEPWLERYLDHLRVERH